MKLNLNHPAIQNMRIQDLKKMNSKYKQAKSLQQAIGSKSCYDIFCKAKQPGEDIFEYLGIERLEEWIGYLLKIF